MTDPERIWVAVSDFGERHWQEDDFEPATLYIRADLLDAAVNEARAAAIRAARVEGMRAARAAAQRAADDLIDARNHYAGGALDAVAAIRDMIEAEERGEGE